MLELVTAPAALPVDPAEAYEHLKLEASPLDASLIEQYIRTAVARLDGKNGLLGRCLVDQQWRLLLDYFPCEIALPLPPLKQVDSITYIDPQGAGLTLDPSNYAVYGTDPATIKPAYGKDFPDTRDIPYAVAVTFTAGYGTDHTTIPNEIKQAIYLDVAHLYENRESVLIGQTASLLPDGYLDRLTNFRQWSF